MNQTVGRMRPKDGRTERSQPNTIPRSLPPAVEIGRPAHLQDQRADQRARLPVAAPMNATSATSVSRSATPASLTAAVSCVRPDDGEDVATLDLGVRQDGDVVAVAPRVIFSGTTPRAAGFATSSQRLAVDRLVGHMDVDTSIGTFSSSGSSTSAAFGPITFTSTSRGRHDHALAQHGVHGGILDHPLRRA